MTVQLLKELQDTDRKISSPDKACCLDIRLDQEITPPTNRHNLLLGFQFGDRPAVSDHPAVIQLQLQPLNCHQAIESWWYEGEVNFQKTATARIAACKDYSVVIVQKEFTGPENFRTQTRQAYRELLDAVKATQHSRLVKVWNYFGDINNGADDSEKYRQFSIGREQAFQDQGINHECAPTATAIGTQGDSGLALIALVSNGGFSPVENPRQVSAYNYPREYGPSSPKFSRGGFVAFNNHKLFLISGTAAIVGHQTNFPNDSSLQLDETIKNLGSLCDAISARVHDETQFVLDEKSVLRVYVKDPMDYLAIRQKIEREMNLDPQNVVFLQGTICREELVVEIEGVKVV